MSKMVAIDKTAHRDVRIDHLKVEGLGNDTNMVPIVMTEFLKAATRFPIVFTKNVETGRFSVIILCGFEIGENLFYRAGTWDSLYADGGKPLFNENGDAEKYLKDMQSMLAQLYHGEKTTRRILSLRMAKQLQFRVFIQLMKIN